MGKKMLSKSRIQTFCKCSLAYKFQYIDKIEVEPSPAMIKGIELHKMFEDFFKMTRKNRYDKKSFLERAKDKSDYFVHLNNFSGFFENFLNLSVGKRFYPVLVEEKICDFDLGLVGVIDVAFEYKDGLLLLDYKTGKYNPQYKSDGRFGLALYKHLFDLISEKKAVYWGEYYSATNDFWVEGCSSFEMSAMYSKVEDVRKRIGEGVFEPCRSVLCGWCQYSDNCKEFNKK